MKGQGHGGFAFDSSKAQGAVVGSEIITFAPGVTAVQRMTLANALLLAQLIANHRAPASQDLDMGWYDRYLEVLSELGFVIHEDGFAVYHEGSDIVDMKEAICDVAQVRLAGAPTALHRVMKMLETLTAMPPDSSGIALLQRESCSGTTARFGVAHAEADEDGRIRLDLMFFGLESRTPPTSVLLSRFRNTELDVHTGEGSVSSAHLSELQTYLAEQLGSPAQSFVVDVPIEAPAAQAIEPMTQPPTTVRAERDPTRPMLPDAEPVDAAVFCPPYVARGTRFLAQLFLYPPGSEAAVESQARSSDNTALKRGAYSLPLDLKRGTRVDLHLEVPGLSIAEPDAIIVWRGRPSAVQFDVGVPVDYVAQVTIARVCFAIDGMPAGTLRFKLDVVEGVEQDCVARVQRIQGVKYRRAFVSYSSADRGEVLRRVQAFKIAGMSVFQDILSLDPGERWARALYREIDQCDVFLLFWSHAAATSEWVAKEIEYALVRKACDEDGLPEIQPVPIEGPPIPPPPKSLETLHFNDALLAHIATSAPSRATASFVGFDL